MSVCLRLSFLAMLLSLSIISFIPSQQAAGPDVAIYWGQNNGEGSVGDKCSSGYYNYVIIGYLTNYSQGQTPALNLDGHCDPTHGGCTYLGREIKGCQNQGIKVFLALGNAKVGPPDDVDPIPSILHARWLANYIWDHYLGGQSSDRPFGDAELDGVDFESQPPGTGLQWLELALFLKYISCIEGRKIYLSASPQCSENDDAVINTGLVDYAWVRFFNNSDCEYKPNNIDGLLDSWSKWSSRMGNNTLLMGLPSSESSDGYISPDVFTTKVRPVIETYPNYGGVMVWTQFQYDSYTPKIKNKNDIKLYSVE